MKSADNKELTYQILNNFNMEHKFTITEKLRHFLYCLVAVVLWFIYKSPEKVSLINDNLCCRYGYCKYPFVKNKGQFPRFIKSGSYGMPAIYDHYDSKRYFLFPLPTWLNKLHWKHYR